MRVHPWMVCIFCLLILLACQNTPEPTEVVPTMPVDSPLPTPVPQPETLPSPEALGEEELILFVSNRDGHSAYYVMNVDGSAPRPLVFAEPPAIISDLHWVPILDRFVFSGNTGEDQEIFLANWERTQYWRLTETPGVIETSPLVSPDGQWVAAECAQVEPDICLVGSDGADWNRLTAPPAWDATPSWSADSQKIVFVSNIEGIADLYLTDIQASDPRKLTAGGRNADPDWSPDGSQILYASDVDGSWDIWTMAPDGQDARNLTENPAANMSPRWSPDGQWIAFRSNRDGNWEIYVMAADGQDARNLSQTPAAEAVFAWSLDSSQVLFVSDVEGNLDIFKVNLDGSNRVNLTQHPAEDAAPIWFRHR